MTHNAEFPDPALETIGTMAANAQHPPDDYDTAASLAWRTGYQNAMADLISDMYPGFAGGRRLTIDEVRQGDTLRGGAD